MARWPQPIALADLPAVSAGRRDRRASYRVGRRAGRRVGRRVGAWVALVAVLAWLVFDAQPTVSAAVVSVIDDQGNIVTDFSEDNELDVDVAWSNNNAVTLQVSLTSADTGPLAFSGFQHNRFTGGDWRGFVIELTGGPVFSQVNAADAGNGLVSSVQTNGTGSRVDLAFGPNLLLGDSLTLGLPNDSNPHKPKDVIDPGLDWFINLNGLGFGDTFTLRLAPSAVPEPSSMAIFAVLGAGCFGAARLRRRRKRNAAAV